MNNKGQTLVIFVLILPIILLVLAYVTDTGVLFYEKSKLDNIQKTVVNSFGTKTEVKEEEIRALFLKNDNDIKIISIKIENDTITTSVEKSVKSIFGNVIGLKYYKVKGEYTGFKE